MSRQALIAPHVQAFFAEHLCQHKRVSPQTIASYRDTFRLLLTFVKEATGKEPSALCIHDLDAPLVLRFLDYLEHQRGNAIRSRNMRLAAIRSFARFLALRDPESLAITTRVLAIPGKRADKKLIGYLTRDGSRGPAGGTRSLLLGWTSRLCVVADPVQQRGAGLRSDHLETRAGLLWPANVSPPQRERTQGAHGAAVAPNQPAPPSVV